MSPQFCPLFARRGAPLAGWGVPSLGGPWSRGMGGAAGFAAPSLLGARGLYRAAAPCLGLLGIGVFIPFVALSWQGGGAPLLWIGAHLHSVAPGREVWAM